MTATQHLLGVLLAPLVSAAVIACFLRRRGPLAATVSVGAAGAACVFLLLALQATGGSVLQASVPWLSLGDFEVRMGFLFDNTAATMCAMVVLVGFLIHLFSVGYMEKDDSRGRFFGGLSIFMFSMLGIVLADNLIMIFVFWELVGFSSYMLIGHYLKTKEAADASKKAFIVNRVGDLGFLVGIALAYWHFGTVELSAMEAKLALEPGLVNAGIAALLMCGFIGKSAQFPLHVWLPDAMAGPTPVSALIHAATMVAAGVYFLIRTVFLYPPEVLAVITWLGAAMAVYAGFCAFAQNDIKRILAYSTLSQLGYMAAAFGLGFPGVALFHLITHAFFKALLFLGAGSVIHGCHHEQDIFKMGGLFRRMPVTALTFLVGVLALCGVYGLAGFYSKDAILIGGGLTNTPAYAVLLLGAFLTAGYMGRLYWIAFLGKPNSENASHAKESPLVMVVPLIVLAVFSVAGGWMAYWPEVFGSIIREDLDHMHHMTGYKSLHGTVIIIGSLAWIIGFSAAFFFYGRGATADRLEKLAGPVFGFLRARLWFDEVYDFYVAKVQQRVADIAGFFDLFAIKGVLVRGSAGIAGLAGLVARGLHTGNIHSYVYWFLAGVAVLWALAGGWL